MLYSGNLELIISISIVGTTKLRINAWSLSQLNLPIGGYDDHGISKRNWIILKIKIHWSWDLTSVKKIHLHYKSINYWKICAKIKINLIMLTSKYCDIQKTLDLEDDIKLNLKNQRARDTKLCSVNRPISLKKWTN